MTRKITQEVEMELGPQLTYPKEPDRSKSVFDRLEVTRLILDGMQGLIRKGWCQKSMALDDVGNFVKATDKNAVSWCLVGSYSRSEHDVMAQQTALNRSAEKTDEFRYTFGNWAEMGWYVRKLLHNAIYNKPGACGFADHHYHFTNLATRYNDEVGRTKEDVLDVIAKALEEVKAKQKE